MIIKNNGILHTYITYTPFTARRISGAVVVTSVFQTEGPGFESLLMQDENYLFALNLQFYFYIQLWIYDQLKEHNNVYVH